MAKLKILSLLLVSTCFMNWHLTANFAQSTQTRGPGTSCFILGAVKKPGVHEIDSVPSVLKLIVLAGGLSDTHGPAAFIIRRRSPETERRESEVDFGGMYRLLRVDISGLLKGVFEKDALLEAGDIVYIPAGAVFFVAGEVTAPGNFSMKEGMTVRRAMTLAHGVNSSARIEGVLIFRIDRTTGKREEIKVNLGDVMNGKAVDIFIEADDIIVVPKRRD